MRPALKIIIAIPMFYALTAAMLFGTTVAHEAAHFWAHEGLDTPSFTVASNADEARSELVVSDKVTVDGRVYKMENVAASTVVIYDDAFRYAFSLNTLPASSYEDGRLAATFLHRDVHDAEHAVRGEQHAGAAWVALAPILLGLAGLVAAGFWFARRRSLVAGATLLAFASEVGNNAHHAAELGMSSGIYQVGAAIILGSAIIALAWTAFQHIAPMTGAPVQATRVAA